jgi:RNA polymerase sigma-70 factor (ECF subfamily)
MHLHRPLVDWTGLVDLLPDLARCLATRCRDPHDVEDAVQESFVRAARYRRADHPPQRLKPWLLRIGLNVLAERGRRVVRRPMDTVDDSELDERIGGREPHEVVDEREIWVRGRSVGLTRARAMLRRALGRIPVHDRVALGGLFVEQRSRDDIAQELGIPTPLLKVRLFRAKRRLRHALERELEAAA